MGNSLITISEKGDQQVVSAKELYLGLGLNKTNWSRWYPTNIQDNDFFIENIDWVRVRHNDEGNESVDFAISLEFAKHIAMMARTEKSHEYRNYFIKCETKLRDSQSSKPQCIEDVLIQSLQEMKDMRLQIDLAKEETAAVKQEVEDIREVIEIKPSESWRNETNSLIKKICFKLKDYQKPKEEIYKALQERAACDLKRRLENMRARLILNGGSKSKADALNYLDVIAEDKKLIEIYTAIVKEMAIKHKIA